jgi:hypothetical protein
MVRRRTRFYLGSEHPPVPIDHSKLCDGFAQLAFSKFYRDRDATCGVCRADFLLDARAQKEILERNGVPLKMLDRGAAFCPSCLPRRRRLNELNRWRRRLLEEMSLSDGNEQNPVPALNARCTLLENFGEGDALKGLQILNEAARDRPESPELAALRSRLRLLLHAKEAPSAAVELERLRNEEHEIRSKARYPAERDTLHPCDLEAPVRCPHCALETRNPLSVYDNAMVCPRCDGHFDLVAHS